jgi:hypothetical protein
LIVELGLPVQAASAAIACAMPPPVMFAVPLRVQSAVAPLFQR